MPPQVGCGRCGADLGHLTRLACAVLAYTASPMTCLRVGSFVLLALAPLALGGLGACRDSSAEFTAPRKLTAEQRPTRWDAPDRQRLGVQDPTAASREGARSRAAVEFTAASVPGFAPQPAQPQRFRDLIWQIEGDGSSECYLTAFVGGSAQQNLDRWYGQMGQAPKPLTGLPRVPMAGDSGYLLELEGTYNSVPGQAMAIAFLVREGGVTTLKFTGPAAVVQQHRAGFLALAASLQERRGEADAKAARAGLPPATGLPPADAQHAGVAPPAVAPHGSGAAPAAQPFTAQIPASWTPKPDSMRALHHAFGGDGDVYVGQMGGGSLRQMLDIWRGEVGQGPASDEEFAAVPTFELLGQKGRFLDVGGEFHSMSNRRIPNARVLVAACEHEGSILFVKLVGSASTVASEVEPFRSFCASLRRNP